VKEIFRLYQKYVLCFHCLSVALIVPAYVGQAQNLPCRMTTNIVPSWMYQETEDAQRHSISVNGNLSSDHNARYSTDGNSLIINEVRLSDAGIYLCGRGKQLYHKLNLSVSGKYCYLQGGPAKVRPTYILLVTFGT